MVSEIIVTKGIRVKISWFPRGKKIPPRVTQVSGYCFNKKGEVLIVKNKNGHWNFPGGHPEEKETPVETLKREIWEEAKVEIKEECLIGYQKIECLQKPYLKEGKTHHQLRYICLVKKISKFTADFETRERKFVKQDHLDKFIPWVKGKTAQAQVNLLNNFYKQNFTLKKHRSL